MIDNFEAQVKETMQKLGMQRADAEAFVQEANVLLRRGDDPRHVAAKILGRRVRENLDQQMDKIAAKYRIQ
jgi:hypothetical protein